MVLFVPNIQYPADILASGKMLSDQRSSSITIVSDDKGLHFIMIKYEGLVQLKEIERMISVRKL